MATLIAAGKITSETTLAAALRDAIRVERMACGKRFLHSNAQIDELWKSLVHALPKNSFEEMPEKPSALQTPAKSARNTESDTEPEKPVSTDVPEKAVDGATIPANPAPKAKSNNPTLSVPANANNAVRPGHVSTGATTTQPKTRVPPVPVLKKTIGNTHLVQESTENIDPAFQNHERADNEFHVYWNIACKLLKKIDGDRAARFENAFNVGNSRGLIKHLSKRQLAAVLANINAPQNDEGFIVDEFLLQNLTGPECDLIRTLQIFKPEASEDAFAKSRKDVEADLNNPGHRAAIQRALHSDPDTDDLHKKRARLFTQASFQRWSNRGGGDCLFHALHSEGDGFTLSKKYVQKIREQTALVRLYMDDGNHVGSNWHQMMISTDNTAIKNAFNENGIPLELSNLQFADLQRRPGNFSGDEEIEQWLALPGNPTRSVVIIDGLVGKEKIVMFERGENGEVSRKAFDIEALCGGKNLNDDQFRLKIQEKIRNALNHVQNREHLAIYRSVMHFERIVGFIDEDLNLWARARRGLSRVAELRPASANA